MVVNMSSFDITINILGENPKAYKRHFKKIIVLIHIFLIISKRSLDMLHKCMSAEIICPEVLIRRSSLLPLKMKREESFVYHRKFYYYIGFLSRLPLVTVWGVKGRGPL